ASQRRLRRAHDRDAGAVRARDPRLAGARARPPAVGRGGGAADRRRRVGAPGDDGPRLARGARRADLRLGGRRRPGARPARPPGSGRPDARCSPGQRAGAGRAADLRRGVAMTAVWAVLLVGAVGGWAVLDGMNQGLGATLRVVATTPGERRTVLTAL